MKTKEIAIISLSAALNTILMSLFPWIGLVILSVWIISFKLYQAIVFTFIVAILSGFFSTSPLVWFNIVLLPLLALCLHLFRSWMMVGYSKKGCLSANHFDWKRTLAISSLSFIFVNFLNEVLSFSLVHFNQTWLYSGLGLAFGLSILNAIILSITINTLVKVISKGFLKLSLI
jgi:hypothetical protein